MPNITKPMNKPNNKLPSKEFLEWFIGFFEADGCLLIPKNKQLYAIILSNNKDLTDDQKKDYKNLIERQYQNISYKIKDENTSGENATVTVEVETFDYRSALNKSEEYYENNKKKFQKDDGKIDQEKYWDYKISEMKKILKS